jgi:hypothetical protein
LIDYKQIVLTTPGGAGYIGFWMTVPKAANRLAAPVPLCLLYSESLAGNQWYDSLRRPSDAFAKR